MLRVEAIATYSLAPDWALLELTITLVKKFLNVCLKNFASWLITYPLLGKI